MGQRRVGDRPAVADLPDEVVGGHEHVGQVHLVELGLTGHLHERADLDAWIVKVQLQGPDPLRKTLSAFKNWRQEILAFFQFLPTRISNGFVEGKNNRTKALMRQGYGYRNRHHLRLRILLEQAA